VTAQPAASLKARALKLLAQREHSRAELRRKLVHAATTGAAADDAAAEVDAVIEWLAANRWFDEGRFVEARVHAREARYGNRRIEAELAQHGVTLGDQAAAALRASELSRAREVWRKRFGASPSTAAERAKQMRFLAARGFTPDVIRRAIAAADDD
jgi:regulatory protein